jgi:Trypsin
MMNVGRSGAFDEVVRRCIPRGDLGVLSSLVYFAKMEHLRIPDGFGVEVRPNWVLTCEHVAAKPADEYVVLNAGVVDKPRTVRFLFIQGDDQVYARRDIKALHREFDCRKLERERLALVNLRNFDYRHEVAPVQFVEGGDFSDLQFVRASPEDKQDNCAVRVVDGVILRKPSAGGETEDFGLYTSYTKSKIMKAEDGDSGGAAIRKMEGSSGIEVVGIHHAIFPRCDGSAANRFIPMDGVASWIDSIVKNFD